MKYTAIPDKTSSKKEVYRLELSHGDKVLTFHAFHLQRISHRNPAAYCDCLNDFLENADYDKDAFWAILERAYNLPFKSKNPHEDLKQILNDSAAVLGLETIYAYADSIYHVDNDVDDEYRIVTGAIFSYKLIEPILGHTLKFIGRTKRYRNTLARRKSFGVLNDTDMYCRRAQQLVKREAEVLLANYIVKNAGFIVDEDLLLSLRAHLFFRLMYRFDTLPRTRRGLYTWMDSNVSGFLNQRYKQQLAET